MISLYMKLKLDLLLKYEHLFFFYLFYLSIHCLFDWKLKFCEMKCMWLILLALIIISNVPWYRNYVLFLLCFVISLIFPMLLFFFLWSPFLCLYIKFPNIELRALGLLGCIRENIQKFFWYCLCFKANGAGIWNNFFIRPLTSLI